jgi:hypothetical protein
MSDTFFKEFFISGLKDEILSPSPHDSPPDLVGSYSMCQGSPTCCFFPTPQTFFPSCPLPPTPSPHPTPLKIQKLTWEEMVECQLKGLCYNCDEKYFLGHKCKEQKLFMAISEDVVDDEIEASHAVELPEPTPITLPSDPPEVEPVISLNALTGFSAPQTLKLIGYIKNGRSSS